MILFPNHGPGDVFLKKNSSIRTLCGCAIICKYIVCTMLVSNACRGQKRALNVLGTEGKGGYETLGRSAGNQTCVLCESRESSRPTQLDTFLLITTGRGWHWYLVGKGKEYFQIPCCQRTVSLHW